METVDTNIAAAEARTDTKFAELRGDMGTMMNSMATKSTIWGAVATALGIGLAVLAIAGDRFDGGFSASSSISEMHKQQEARDSNQDAKLDEILKRLPPAKEAGQK